MKILIVGYGRHGKDTVAEYLRDNHHLTFKSSSVHVAENIIYPALKDQYGYTSAEQCFNDRAAHRKEWYDLISDYCIQDLARVGREIFTSFDIYCGLRSKREFHSIKNNGLFDAAIWVDRSDHLPPEDVSSNTIEPWMTDYVIDNNGTLPQLYRNIEDLLLTLKGKYDLWEKYDV